ncbi:MAG: thiosulfate/3-mercaptopyruvate sulfurtransferase [Porticoccus sp.]|jgi:thiosulfate/3-mercaptopyruvate sulfurtransferase
MNQWLTSAHEIYSIKENNTVIFDCIFSLVNHNMNRSLYQLCHIPGAFHIKMETDLSGRKRVRGGRHPLPDAEVFSARMSQCGVSHN